jgi:predicted glycosyltransferase
MTGHLGLAPDPGVPQRDALLDGPGLAPRLDELLGVDGRLGVQGIEPVRVKYRVGRSVGLVLRVRSAIGSFTVSARSFADKEALARHARAPTGAPDPSGPIRPVGCAAELATVFWVFPRDRRLRSLGLLAGPSDRLAALIGAPCVPQLVAYVPEKSATARCLDDRDRVVAYIKAYGDHEDALAHRTKAIHEALADSLDDGRVRIPRVLGHDHRAGVLVVEALDGRPVEIRPGSADTGAVHALGGALAALHAVPAPPWLPTRDRVTHRRLERAAELIAAVRPDLTAEVTRLAGSLCDTFADDGQRVCLHGDPHLKNALVGGGPMALIDLDQACLGTPAADLGSVLAALWYRRCVGLLAAQDRRALADALLSGYASVRELPDPRSLSWHTAASLLSERALRAVTRVRAAGLARLPEVVACAKAEIPRRRASRGAGPPALLLYCQHATGLGHLMRSLALASGLAERFAVTVLSGGEVPRHITAPDGVAIIPLPPLIRDLEGRIVPSDGQRTAAEVRTLRAHLVRRAVRDVHPDVVVVELFPFGRRKFAAEIAELLQQAGARPEGPPLVICSLRDILVRRGAEQAAFDEHACELANAQLDAILVHADPRLTRLEDSFHPRTPLAVPVHYTGFVAAPGARPTRDVPRQPRIVVSAGGGRVGEPLLRAALDAQPRLWREDGLAMRVIAGPFLAEESWHRLCALAAGRDGLELRRAVPDLGAELRCAQLSVSQCGYNTALDVLQARLPAVVVPFAAPGEDEQRRRAQLLAGVGVVRMLDPDDLSASTLTEALRSLRGVRPPRIGLDLNGVRASSELVWRLVTSATHVPTRSVGR